MCKTNLQFSFLFDDGFLSAVKFYDFIFLKIYKTRHANLCFWCGLSLSPPNTELIDLRKLFVSENLKLMLKEFRNITEKLAEHGIHCLSCSNVNDVIEMLPLQL